MKWPIWYEITVWTLVAMHGPIQILVGIPWLYLTRKNRL
jgi:hypothetical protein